jgi:hypothetical protein
MSRRRLHIENAQSTFVTNRQPSSSDVHYATVQYNACIALPQACQRRPDFNGIHINESELRSRPLGLGLVHFKLLLIAAFTFESIVVFPCCAFAHRTP